MENSYLLDTNIIIYYFDGIFSEDNNEIDLIFENNFTVSIISKIEFLGWVGFKEPGLYAKAKDFIDKAVVMYIDDAIAEEAIRIRREHKVKTPDAIIAATALVNGLVLATTNTDDFKKLNLTTLNPF
ncbi:MAG: nucleotide-binding protein [Spirochaetes bacterium RBG_13_51_14]|nr:MAG: nucleotide-binding protein [Spirochaetes bacterium RBG_13_51_14]